MRTNGRLGFIVPSGLYSDHGTGGLRQLFLDRCRWEWLFGFENRDKVFEIDSRFKFNPVIIEKGGKTEAIRTAFMRRKLEDWERAEELATLYTRAQVERFSPRSKAILEIQSQRDLEILEKIYANSVLLGDEGPDGWGIKYAQGDFNMTSDSKLFPPRPKWEADGYRPDEYSRWLKGDWRPIAELWSELDVKPLPEGDRRCAQPPYDTLPIPRADIPAGVILSREADAWVREERVEDVALPLYEGRLFSAFDFAAKNWLSGSGLSAQWSPGDSECKFVNPQYLTSERDVRAHTRVVQSAKVSYRNISRNTDTRSVIGTVIMGDPTPHMTSNLVLTNTEKAWALCGVINSFVFDFVARQRLTGTHLDQHLMTDMPLPVARWLRCLQWPVRSLAGCSQRMAHVWIEHHVSVAPTNHVAGWRGDWSRTTHHRLEKIITVDAIATIQFGLSLADLHWVVGGCAWPVLKIRSNMDTRLSARGFWRVDKDKDPELRHTVLTLVAFHDLEEKIRACGGDREKGIEAFLNQNNGEGWMLPETLRLADYGLGHDERAKHPQPVASRLGPRFYDWQLAQPPEESWRECHLHARNLLGESGYRQLLADIEAEKRGEKPGPAKPAIPPNKNERQGRLFE